MSASTRASLTTRETNTGKTRNSSSQANKANLSPIINTPVDQISFLQRTVGNRGVEGLLKSGLIQAKLKVNEPGDIYEQEADRIAGQVLATPAHVPVGGTGSRIQRAAGQPIGRGATAHASVEHALANAGEPLEPTLRQEMEQRFGWDFSRVHVHTGPAAEQSARDVNARAYTVGDNLVFGAGEFKPDTRQGRRLLAHELTHVVQQSGAEANVVRRSNGTDDDEPTRVWPRAGTVPEPIPAGAERGGARGHVERGGQIYPGEEVHGEIITGGSRGPTSRGAGRPGGGVGGAIGPAIVSLIIAFIGGRILQNLDNKRIQKALNKMQPEIQAALNRRQGEIEKLLQQTHMTKTIYANVQVDVIYSFMVDPDPGAGPMVDYQDTKLIGVGVSTQDITREDLVREQYLSGHDNHHLYTYSVPIAEPAALVLPLIRNVHNLLAGIRTDLMAARGGTAGEAVALDDLKVAQQATDFTGRSVFQNKTAAERFHLTVDAITGSLSVLEGPSSGNPSLQSLRGRLMMVKSMVNGLASRWLVTVGEHGQQPG